MIAGPDGMFMTGEGPDKERDFEPQLTPREFQALFKMSNGNVIPQASKFFGAWRYCILCTVCKKRKEIEAEELESVHNITPSSAIYVWCASHKHLKLTPELEVTTAMPLPVVEIKSNTRKFKGD